MIHGKYTMRRAHEQLWYIARNSNILPEFVLLTVYHQWNELQHLSQYPAFRNSYRMPVLFCFDHDRMHVVNILFVWKRQQILSFLHPNNTVTYLAQFYISYISHIFLFFFTCISNSINASIGAVGRLYIVGWCVSRWFCTASSNE